MSSSRPAAGSCGVYVQAISAYAPHPNAAKLWMEYLYSDEGQTGWLKGYCYPIRFDGPEGRGASRPTCSPSCRTSTGAVFPTSAQATAAKDADHQAVGLGRRRRRQVGTPTHIRRS